MSTSIPCSALATTDAPICLNPATLRFEFRGSASPEAKFTSCREHLAEVILSISDFHAPADEFLIQVI